MTKTTKGFFDSAQAAGRRVGTDRGAPAIGSPSQGITEASSFGWLDQISGIAENATTVINAVKGGANPPKTAAVTDTPAKIAANNAIGGLNPQIVWIAGAAILVFLALYFFKK